jgi:hypothetical protein
MIKSRRLTKHLHRGDVHSGTHPPMMLTADCEKYGCREYVSKSQVERLFRHRSFEL